MKKNNYLIYFISILFFLLLGLCFLTYKKSYHVSQPCIKIGLLDGDKIWTQLPAIKHLKTELNTVLKNHQKKFSNLELELRKENQELIQLQQSLDSRNKQQREIIEHKQKEFSNKVITIQKKAEETQKKVNDLYEHSMAIIREKINQSIKKNALKKNLSLVLYYNQIAYHEESLDITDDVFKDLESFQHQPLKW